MRRRPRLHTHAPSRHSADPRDVAFITRDRIEAIGIDEWFWPEAPALVAEVPLSVDTANERLVRIANFLAAGAHMAWVLWPRSRSVSVHTPDGASRELGPDATLDGGDLLPGFSVTVGQLFNLDRKRG